MLNCTSTAPVHQIVPQPDHNNTMSNHHHGTEMLHGLGKMTDSIVTRDVTLNRIVTTWITTIDWSHHAITIDHATRMIVVNTLTNAITRSTTIAARTTIVKTVTYHGIHGMIDNIIAVFDLWGITDDTSTTIVTTICAPIIGDPQKSSVVKPSVVLFLAGSRK